MEEEGGDDSEMIDAMEGWDSEDNNDDQTEGVGNKEKKSSSKQTGATVDATWVSLICYFKSMWNYDY